MVRLNKVGRRKGMVVEQEDRQFWKILEKAMDEFRLKRKWIMIDTIAISRSI